MSDPALCLRQRALLGCDPHPGSRAGRWAHRSRGRATPHIRAGMRCVEHRNTNPTHGAPVSASHDELLARMGKEATDKPFRQDQTRANDERMTRTHIENHGPVQVVLQYAGETLHPALSSSSATACSSTSAADGAVLATTRRCATGPNWSRRSALTSNTMLANP